MNSRLAPYSVIIETRMDSHYPNQMVSLGSIAELFGIAGTKLAMMFDGDVGLMRAFEKLEFVAPAYQGDFIRVTAHLLDVGRTSRRRSYEAHVTARVHGMSDHPSHGEVLEEPILIAHAVGIAVTPVASQRRTPVEFRAEV